MEESSSTVKLESIKSIQSTIRKLDKGLAQMAQKGANSTLIRKRLDAHNIGLAILEAIWNDRPHQYSQDELVGARVVLGGLVPTIQKSYDKSKEGSSQRTLLVRRLNALQQAIQAIDKIIAK